MVTLAIEISTSVISRTVVWNNDSILFIPTMKKVKASKYYKERASTGLWKVVYHYVS